MTKASDFSAYKALYLEDDALIALDGEDMLRAIGFSDVHVAYTVEDAAGAVQSKPFDFALLDIDLGDGTNSVPFARQLIDGGTMVAFASGYSAPDGLVSELDAPIVVKPFEESAIRAAFASLIARRAGRMPA